MKRQLTKTLCPTCEAQRQDWFNYFCPVCGAHNDDLYRKEHDAGKAFGSTLTSDSIRAEYAEAGMPYRRLDGIA